MKNRRMCCLIALTAMSMFAACATDDDDDGHDIDDDDEDVDDDDDDAWDPADFRCVPTLDFDGDGEGDILVSVRETGRNDRLYLARPGTLELGYPILTAPDGFGFEDVEVADFDGNGAWDLLVEVGREPPATYAIYMNGDFSAPAWETPFVFEAPAVMDSVPPLLVDLDGNNRPELLVGTAKSADEGDRYQEWTVYDTDNDFAELFTLRTPVYWRSGFEWLLERVPGLVFPAASVLGGEPVFVALAQGGDYNAEEVRVLAYSAVNGDLVAESPLFDIGWEGYYNLDIEAADFDGDGETEVLLSTHPIGDEPKSTFGNNVIGGADLGDIEYAGEVESYRGLLDLDLDGVAEAELGEHLTPEGARHALTGVGGWHDVLTIAPSGTLAVWPGRALIGTGYPTGDGAAAVFVEWDRSVADVGASVRPVDLAAGTVGEAVLDIPLPDRPIFWARLMDLGADGVMELAVLARSLSSSKSGNIEKYSLFVISTAAGQILSTFDLYEPGKRYTFDFESERLLDLTGDDAPDILLTRWDRGSETSDFLFFACDAAGCDDPTLIDLGADEHWRLPGRMM